MAGESAWNSGSNAEGHVPLFIRECKYNYSLGLGVLVFCGWIRRSMYDIRHLVPFLPLISS